MLKTLGQWHLNLRGSFATGPRAPGSTISPTHTISGLHYYCIHLFRSVSNRKGLWAIYKDTLNKTRWSPAPLTARPPLKEQSKEENEGRAACSVRTEVTECSPLITRLYLTWSNFVLSGSWDGICFFNSLNTIIIISSNKQPAGAEL